MRAPHSSAGSTAVCLGILQCRTSATGFLPSTPNSEPTCKPISRFRPRFLADFGNSEVIPLNESSAISLRSRSEERSRLLLDNDSFKYVFDTTHAKA